MPTFAVIITNRNDGHYLDGCLGSLLKERVFNKVIVVDNCSTDNSVAVVDKWRSRSTRVYLIINRKNIGPAGARNKALKLVTEEWLIFLDADTKLIQVNSRALINWISRQDYLGAGVFKLLRWQGNKFDSVGEKISPFGFLAEMAQGKIDKGQFDNSPLIFSGKGAAMFTRTELFRKLGGFDKDFYMYWEEPDYFWRVLNSGFINRFCPFLTFRHAFGSRGSESTEQTNTNLCFLGCRNQLWALRKNSAGLLRLKFVFAVTTTWFVIGLFSLFMGRPASFVAIIKAILVGLSAKINRGVVSAKIEANLIDDRDITWYWGKFISYLNGRPF